MPTMNRSNDRGLPEWGSRYSGMDRERSRPVMRAPQRRPRERSSGRIGRGNVGPLDEDPHRKVKVMIVAVATVLFLAILPFWISAVWVEGEDQGGAVMVQDTFTGGSKRVLVNTTYTGRDVSFTLPDDARIDKAYLKLSGGLPPQKISFQAGRNPIDLAVGDINGDLFVDVVVANNKDDKVMVMNNHGEGLMRGAQYSVGRGPIRVELSELNGDGYLDLIVLSEDSRELWVLLNDQIGGFRVQGEPYGFETLPADMAVFDIDGDGDNDTA
ncbi:MAG: VCBS repeat-containing protein, partial [Candidatus Thermoplasmatota archaeon]|nr:VCBS repeat-containing protein [Candidatus Thermoplasmatota archaeon]